MRKKIYCLLLMGTAMTATLSSQAQVSQAQVSRAQANQEVDLAVTYSTEYSNLVGGAKFWRQGGSIELSAEVYRGFGLALNVSGNRISNINNTGINLTAVTTTAGPRYTWSPRSRKWAIFGQGLLGESHGIDSVFPDSSGLQTSDISFALQVGGGVDWRVGKHFAIRPIQTDWIRTEFPNSTTNVQNSLRLGSGIVLRLY